MAGFGQNDEVVSPKAKTFGANDEVVSSGENDATETPASQAQVLTHPPTTIDRISSEVNGGGSMLDPQKIVQGVGNSLGRTTQAWGDMFSGHANPHTLAEMVPLVGPAAVDATQKMFTPGQRVEGMTDAAMMLAPGAKNIPEMIPEIPSSIRAIPSVSSGAVRGAVSGAFPVMEYGAHKFPLPASLAGAAAGHFAGSPFGPIGSEIGALVGGAAPIVRGAIQGGKEALNNFRANEILSSPVPPRLAGDVFSRESFSPMPLSREEGGNFVGVRLPSGRAVGPSPRVNEVFQPEVPDTQRVPLWRDIVPSERPVTSSAPIRSSLPSGRIPGGASQGGVFAVPNEDQILSPELRAKDTPPLFRERVNSSRAKFDENGKRNQLK